MLSDDELFASDEEDEKELYLSCFMVNKVTGEDDVDLVEVVEKVGKEVLESEKGEVETPTNSFVNNAGSEYDQVTSESIHYQNKQNRKDDHSDEDYDNSEDHSEETKDDVSVKDDGMIDEDQLKNDSIRIRAPTIKELNILDDYLANEGNLPVQPSKCQECLEHNCKQCIKYARSTPAETSVLQE